MPNKINLLSSDIYNRISAGEVVENPSSVVKELVENALDAGSSEITVEIESGGTKLIRVADNGSGIDYSELYKVFLPHATSKIATKQDLDSIATLGFRGEALASIASVAQVELISKVASSDVAGKITISGGENQEIIECSANNGTSVMVKNLFFNTPARLKFLKTTRQEENSVTNIISRLMLANPKVKFKYIVDGQMLYNCLGKTLKERIYMIYGKQTSENLIEINVTNDDFTLSGYILSPTFCKPNRTYQTLIVNGRYVQNATVSVACANAYENFLMKGKFPFFVLNLSINFDDVDVNVHPSKMEIKFKDNKNIYNFVYSSILTTLNENNCAKAFMDGKCEDMFVFEKQQNKPEQPLQKVTGGFSFGSIQNMQSNLKNISLDIVNSTKQELHSTFIQKDDNYKVVPTKDIDNLIKKDNISEFNQKESIDFDKNDLNSLQRNRDKENSFLQKNDFEKKFSPQTKAIKDLQKETSVEKGSTTFDITKLKDFSIKDDVSDNGTCDYLSESKDIEASIDNFDKEQDSNPFNFFVQKEEQQIMSGEILYNLVGTLFSTYLIIEMGDMCYIIDEHAGHERVLYDKFVKQFEEKKVITQDLLVPYIFEVNPLEKNLIEDNLEVYKELGFAIEPFGGNSYKINSFPHLLSGINFEEFISSCLHDTSKISKNNDAIKDKLARHACRSAVKAGNRLSEEEIKILISQLMKKDRILLCPHGRPVCVKLSKLEIEKMFKRIV